MTANTAPRPAARTSGGLRPSLGQVAFGLLLVGGGIAWMLEIAGVASFDWGVLLAVALAAVGGLLLIGAVSGGYGGLIGVGIVLTLVLGTMSLVNIRLEGGIGERTLRPTTAAAVQERYTLGVGDQTIDLTQVPLRAGVTAIAASIGMGDTTIVVPSDVGIRAHWKVGAGDVTVRGFKDSGVGLDRTYTSDNYATAASKLHLELSAGVGSIEVR